MNSISKSIEEMQTEKINLIDTAGIHESDDIVERIGIDKALKTLDDADLVLKISSPDDICEIETDKPYIDVFNKTDVLKDKKVGLVEGELFNIKITTT